MNQSIPDFLTCTQILNIMVILGFMFNYMLRVNLTIAVVAMIKKNDTNSTSTSESVQFDWTEAQKNDILGSFFWGYILTELPGGRLAEVVGAARLRRRHAAGQLAHRPDTPYANYYSPRTPRRPRLLLGGDVAAILPMAAKWIPPTEPLAKLGLYALKNEENMRIYMHAF
ncbi:hypothetical protein MTP99_012906 [Tenebrio molitor]|nr:hypothetical protein MTP99_012906 [Tenebrio molitor]